MASLVASQFPLSSIIAIQVGNFYTEGANPFSWDKIDLAQIFQALEIRDRMRNNLSVQNGDLSVRKLVNNAAKLHGIPVSRLRKNAGTSLPFRPDPFLLLPHHQYLVHLLRDLSCARLFFFTG